MSRGRGHVSVSELRIHSVGRILPLALTMVLSFLARWTAFSNILFTVQQSMMCLRYMQNLRDLRVEYCLLMQETSKHPFSLSTLLSFFNVLCHKLIISYFLGNNSEVNLSTFPFIQTYNKWLHESNVSYK